MYYTFPYSLEFEPVEIPDSNLQGVYNYKYTPAVDDIYMSAKDSIENPIGSPKIEEIAKNKKFALIIADDLSRHTPVKQIIPILCEKLESVGVPKIKILVAMGAQKPLTVDEKKAKFGSYVFDKYDIINHKFNDHLNLTDMGYNSFGSRFYVNRHIFEADLIIGLGEVAPHRVCGFSGGSEIILPGVSGSESIGKLNWDSALYNTNNIFGECENPIREEMDECAKIANLSFIVNCVANPKGEITHIVSGHYQDAFKKACDYCKEVYGSPFLHKSDITIVESFPKDRDLWQASKALNAAELMTKPHGVIIFVSPCKEGISNTYRFISDYGYRSEAETMIDINNGNINNLTVGAHLIKMGRITRDKFNCFMIRNSILPQTAMKLGFKVEETTQAALDKALFLKGSSAIISVLKNGGITLPIHLLKDHFKHKNPFS